MVEEDQENHEDDDKYNKNYYSNKKDYRQDIYKTTSTIKENKSYSCNSNNTIDEIDNFCNYYGDGDNDKQKKKSTTQVSEYSVCGEYKENKDTNEKNDYIKISDKSEDKEKDNKIVTKNLEDKEL